MIWLETMLVALSTYTALPMPQFEWNEKNMRYAICWFPMAGLVVSLGMLLWNWLAIRFELPAVLFAVVATAVPLLITGGIHMDGYMDSVDALASHQSRERMLEIMKDSGCGAFAALYCGVYLLLNFGFWHTAYGLGVTTVLVPMHILSRSLGAMNAVTMPNARKSGMLCAYTENVQKKTAVTAISLVLALTVIGIAAWQPVLGTVEAAAAALTFFWYRHFAKKTFGGVTGDLTGFFIQVVEMVMLAAVMIGGFLV